MLTINAPRVLFATLDPELPRNPDTGGESLQMSPVWRRLRDRERQSPTPEDFEQVESNVDKDGESGYVSWYGDHCPYVRSVYVPSSSTAPAFILKRTAPPEPGIYLLCTSYGAWAVREFLGKEM